MPKIIAVLLLLSAYTTLEIPDTYTYKIIKTQNFDLASWQKITNADAFYKIYIEGDGNAFNASGYPSQDPTPRGTLVRSLAFQDPSPNVIYLARPCQFIKSAVCAKKRHWTTARFAPEIITAEYDAVKQIAETRPVILIGFSGGAQIAGLIATAKPGLNVKKIITIAGNLDHEAWTKYHKLPPLNESMSLNDYRANFQKIPQTHYVGEKDEVILPFLIKEFADQKDVIIVKGATHNKGWESIEQKIWQEK
ncbi:MAG: alpha/beta hydrolase [Alphaproteobacteria bacterium]|nr:alpha/beta hydrolase [Alphaproteobacteria bacterium]